MVNGFHNANTLTAANPKTNTECPRQMKVFPEKIFGNLLESFAILWRKSFSLHNEF